MNAKFIIGLTLIVAFMVLGAYSFFDTQVSSVSFAAAKRTTNKVQVQGAVDFETMQYDMENKRLVFDLIETEPGADERITVIYHGEVPGNFEQATSVTVIGVNGEEGFVAENMLVKCPSKYDGEDGEDHEDSEDVEERSYPAEPSDA